MVTPIICHRRQRGIRWSWPVNSTSRPFYPRETDPVPTVEKAFGPQDAYTEENVFCDDWCSNPWVVQPVDSRYTEFAIPAQK